MRASAVLVTLSSATSWVNPPLQKGVEYRAGDVLLSVTAKSGTTWAMNIFHQLRTGGDPDFKDIYQIIPWLEFKEYPNQTDDELYARWKAMPTDVVRGFKTHAGPGPMLDYHDHVKYVVITRNPVEAAVSFMPFMAGHSDEAFKLWGAEDQQKVMTSHPTFKSFFESFILKGEGVMPPGAAPPGGFLTIWYFGFINGWWPLRAKKNVLLLHYSDMKRDHEGSIRKIADFLGYKPTKEQWRKVLEYTSFKWMKDHGEKFEIQHALCANNPTHPELQYRPDGTCPVPFLKPGGMVRKGALGQAAEDGMTPEIEKQIRDLAEQMVPDPAARKWLFDGGAVPPLDKAEEL